MSRWIDEILETATVWFERNVGTLTCFILGGLGIWYLAMSVLELFVGPSERGFFIAWNIMLWATIVLGITAIYTRSAAAPQDQIDDLETEIDAVYGMQTRSVELNTFRHLSEAAHTRREFCWPRIIRTCFYWCASFSVLGAVALGC